MNAGGDILLQYQGALAVVTLNRPAALNALTHEMALELHAWLRQIEADDKIACVLIQGAGERAFCAGGDIRKLYDEGLAGGSYPYNFYRDEYRLNSDIYHFPKPYVALMDGIVMGGGVGVSVHGSHRIATERTRFAMPETGIGLFPDVGGSHFLSRIPGRIGFYLALTGYRMKAADAIYTNVADCFVASDQLPALIENLAAADYSGDPFARVDAVIKARAGDAGEATLPYLRGTIENYFARATLDEILEALGGNRKDEWAAANAVTMRAKSPTSMRVAFRQISAGGSLDFNASMVMEYRIACGFIAGHDFYEGVRAAVIDKDQAPKWQPPGLQDCSDEDVAGYFDCPAKGGDLSFDTTPAPNCERRRMNHSAD